MGAKAPGLLLKQQHDRRGSEGEWETVRGAGNCERGGENN